MRIAFRVDADHKIGMGHLVRCLALADQLKQRPGAEIIFVTANDRNVRPKVEQAGYGLAAVSSKFEIPNALKGEIIIVDIRDTQLSYMEALRSRGKVLVTFDDLGQGRYTADIMVDANLSPEENLRIVDCGMRNKEKQTRLEGAHRFLLGPGYIILREEFTRLDRQERKITSAVKKVLVTMGGSDPNNLTPKVLRSLAICNLATHNLQSAIRNPQSEIGSPQSAIRNLQSEIGSPQSAIRNSQSEINSPQSVIHNLQSAVGSPQLEVEVVIGPAFDFNRECDFRDYPSETRRPASGCPKLETRNLKFRFRRKATAIHELMWEADLAIASAGITMYELACCGTPAIILAQDSVQAKNTRVFSEAGSIVNLGVGAQVKEEDLARVITDLISDETARLKMSKAGRGLVDGKGLLRVIKKIEEALRLNS